MGAKAVRRGAVKARVGLALSGLGRMAAGAGLLTMQAALAPVPLAAQEGSPSAAVARRTVEFDIPVQSLNSALLTFAERAGLQLIYDVASVRSLRSAPLRGRFTAQDGLNRLLAGTGMAYRFSGPNTVSLQMATTSDSSGVVTLVPVMVSGRAELAVEGFRARQASSATNVAAPLIETPATVNVMSSETMERLNVQRLDDILQYIPGTGPGATGSSMTNTFTIRGFESSTTRGGSLGSRSNSVYIDGHRPASRHYHYDRSLYERVEVLKGTSSVLYGAASPGGIVSYTSKKPLFETRNQLSTTIGSFDTRRASVDLTGPVAALNGLAYRLIATAQEANQPYTGKNHASSFDDRTIVKPQIAWQSDGGTRVDLGYEYSRQNSVADPGILRFSDGSFGFGGRSLVSDDSFSKHTNHIATASIWHPITDQWSISVDGSYGKNHIDALWDSANTRTAPSRTALIDRDVIRFETDFEHREARAKLQGEYQIGVVANTTTIGVSHRREGYDSKRVQRTIRGAINPLDPVFASVGDLGPYTGTVDWTIREQGVYIQNYARVGEKLKLFGGLRYTDIRTVFNDTGGTDKAIDYAIGAIFNQNDWLNPFISYSTSLTPQVGTLKTGGPVPFSEGKQLEIGVKSQWFGDAVASTLSIFQITQTNRVETDPADRLLSIIAGDQEVKGMELEVVGKITDNLTFIGGYSYLDTEFTESVLYKGNTPANVPKHKATAMLNYSLDTDFGLWDAGVGYIYVRNRQGDNENSYRLPDYSRFDLSLGWQYESLELRLRAENIFNKKYVSGSSGVFMNQGLPRSVFLNAKVTF
ncbi:iron complex outermembrane receptor protein [Stella humosa]|uniref:Iron complex outermembrane receptor protein n=1 Tax=Stella humosa TaxID=94 RepID=A0A3N1M9S1_9PROT|nr:TonB-dependent receptor [Stella humosa]ROP99978.1 iron complex outermembrane receptor protein [Stella humosa]BBK30791.1 ferrioxamine receptor FoxA [Stella humosa]